MSRYYEMRVEIAGFDPARETEIVVAAKHEWPFGDWDTDEEQPIMEMSGRENLCGGESEQQFAERLARAIWKANGKCCKVTVSAVYLENPPTETYEMDQADYAKLMAS